ncbi:E3 ubiquitin-protein ligase RING1-like protein [Carex littledalei]|uniref:E3 ubiquitin-protein ligase RING1-like protein n=1 Tax=Carex littledalei TaxID=544730 RepID=A0A833QFW2_9POAL|nr:E3 ubiquitin-protein ligase RING1-like protein [Carex littledalei]
MADEQYADIYQYYFAYTYILDEPAPTSNASIQSLKIVERREEEKTEEECTICLEKIFDNENKEAVVKETPCGHIYHGECIDKWLEIHVSCPLCRYKMTPDNGEEEVLEVEMSFSDEDEDQVEIG